MDTRVARRIRSAEEDVASRNVSTTGQSLREDMVSVTAECKSAIVYAGFAKLGGNRAAR